MDRRTFTGSLIAVSGLAIAPEATAQQSSSQDTKDKPMTAFMIVTAAIKDGQKFQEYAQKSGQTVSQFGGTTLVRGMFDSAVVGDASHNVAVVLSFPDMDALKGWYASDVYQALAELRDAAAEWTFTSYSVPS